MRFIVLILLLMTLTHTISATEKTTGNLITNGNFETGNANGWTTTGNVDVLNDCCELNNVTSNYDLEFGNSGSITQDFNLTSDRFTTWYSQLTGNPRTRLDEILDNETLPSQMLFLKSHIKNTKKLIKELKDYLGKVTDEALYAYNVYQIEGIGSSLFSKIEGDENSIMGLPVKKIKEYLDNLK